MWLERLNKSSKPWVHHWLSHQTRDPYWQYGSLAEDYTSITCPVFLIGGFSDFFKDAVFTMVQNLKCPIRALIGPWSHSWPTDSSPGPRIDHLKECLRWFDCHLKGLPTGVMDEPVLRLFLRDGMFFFFPTTHFSKFFHYCKIITLSVSLVFEFTRKHCANHKKVISKDMHLLRVQ